MKEHTAIRLGTSAFTAAGWPGTFYPKGLPTGQYLSHYALHFDTVEVDSTFYRIPSDLTVRNWYARTPKGFLFATKAPQTITHERVLLIARTNSKCSSRPWGRSGRKLGRSCSSFPTLTAWHFQPWRISSSGWLRFSHGCRRTSGLRWRSATKAGSGRSSTTFCGNTKPRWR